MPNNLDELEADVRRAQAWIDECRDEYERAFERYKLAHRALATARIAALNVPDAKVAA